jgi:ABC-type uncharacterized transport system involved in gliding motility auxiliary subunit
MMSRLSRFWLALCLSVIAFLAVNLAAGLTLGSVRFDFTAAHIYTLSPVTIGVLKDLKEPIHIRFYQSPAILNVSGRYASYAEHVRELLGVYARRSHGEVTVETISPESYSAEEDRAFGFGLRGVPVDNEGNQAYFGIVATNSTDQTETIPFLTPEREVFLEYDLTRLISALNMPKKPVIGLMDGVGTSGPGWSAVDQVRQLFTVRMIPPETAKIDPEVSVLMIVHPHDLSPATSFAIDQFVLGGGRALIFVDPDAESINPSANPMMTGASSDLPALFKAWGVAYDPGKVVADWKQAMRIEAESFGRPVVTEFPPYIAAKPPYVKSDDPVTGDLKIVNLVTPGALSPVPGAATIFTPLIQSSPEAALADVADAEAEADPLAFLTKYKPGTTTYTMAARIAGSFKSAYPDGPPKDPHSASAPAGVSLKDSAKPAELIIAADVDMLSDHSWVEMRDLSGQHVGIPFASNGDFVTNALESLTGSPGLSSLRARGVASRPLTRLEDVERDADARYQATEESLSEKLQDVQRQLLTLSGPRDKDSKAGAGSPLLNDQQLDAVKRFRAEMTETRAKLRDVQHDLHRDLDRLEGRIKIVNIGLMPLAVIIFAGLLALSGRRRQ